MYAARDYANNANKKIVEFENFPSKITELSIKFSEEKGS